jgi:hypothetical protein
MPERLLSVVVAVLHDPVRRSVGIGIVSKEMMQTAPGGRSFRSVSPRHRADAPLQPARSELNLSPRLARLLRHGGTLLAPDATLRTRAKLGRIIDLPLFDLPDSIVLYVGLGIVIAVTL